MHLKNVAIKGIRGFESLEWQLETPKLSGWHVVIGDNGSGKSTFLRAISLALCGPSDVQALRENWNTWLRDSEKFGRVTVDFDYQDRWDKWAGRGKKLQDWLPRAGLRFVRDDTNDVEIRRPKFTHDPDRHIWSGKPGWFSAAYGPFRRFTGGDPEQKKLFYSHPFLARHLTIFGENVALTEALEWLGELRFEELDGNKNSGTLLNLIREFVNQDGFLPHSVRFEEVNSKGVLFRNPEGIRMDVARLSDGFRSILSLTFELIRQMVSCFGTTEILKGARHPITAEWLGEITVAPPGVVLIDEIDVHLHPSWQRTIGTWLTKFFPNVQFIVTTHSPLVCQAAENGSIFRLPAPGAPQEGSGFVEGSDRERLIFGDVLDAYGTELFGKGIDRSADAQEQMAELSRLNQMALKKKLTAKQSARQTELSKAFASHAAH